MTKNEAEKLQGFVKRWLIYSEDFSVTECLSQLMDLLDEMPVSNITCLSCGKNCDNVKVILCEHCSKENL